ncbi:hypothetical protein [Candidatus Liberibacter americanus]|nr:hypothetical protein [Candidatus Liberibacter americanus]EMS36183.1 outer membrane lipoprotein [Candidatus Liberibacter americanus PW_SP]
MKTRLFLQLMPIIFIIGSCSIININEDKELSRHEITGYWEDRKGIVSYFQNDGTFKTISTDGSNTVLATGFYNYNSAQNIEISLTSLIRKTSEKIKCKLTKKYMMWCISQTKGQFYLERTHLTEQPMHPDKSHEDLPSLPDDPSAPPTSIIFYE